MELRIVGPLMEKHVDLSSLRDRPNVHFLGRRSIEVARLP